MNVSAGSESGLIASDIRIIQGKEKEGRVGDVGLAARKWGRMSEKKSGSTHGLIDRYRRESRIELAASN